MTEPQHTLKSGVLIPFLQAAATGLLFGLSLGGLAWALHWDSPLQWGLTGGALTSCAAWLLYRSAWEERLHPQPPQPPEIKEATIRVELVQDQGRRGDWIDLPFPDRLPDFARGLTEGRALTTRNWAGGGGLFTGAEYSRLLAELVRRGLARWRSEHDHRAGAELTPPGKAIMRRLSQPEPTKPLPVLTLEQPNHE